MKTSTHQQQDAKPNTPDLEAFVVENREGADKGFWTKIGAAWDHGDGNGLNLVLTCMPLSGQIVLRAPRRDETPASAPARNQRRI